MVSRPKEEARIRQLTQTSRFHIDDLIAIMIQNIDQNIEREIFNIADDVPCSSDEVVEFACDLMGSSYLCDFFTDGIMPMDGASIPKMLNA